MIAKEYRRTSATGYRSHRGASVVALLTQLTPDVEPLLFLDAASFVSGSRSVHTYMMPP